MAVLPSKTLYWIKQLATLQNQNIEAGREDIIPYVKTKIRDSQNIDDRPLLNSTYFGSLF